MRFTTILNWDLRVINNSVHSISEEVFAIAVAAPTVVVVVVVHKVNALCESEFRNLIRRDMLLAILCNAI